MSTQKGQTTSLTSVGCPRRETDLQDLTARLFYTIGLQEEASFRMHLNELSWPTVRPVHRRPRSFHPFICCLFNSAYTILQTWHCTTPATQTTHSIHTVTSRQLRSSDQHLLFFPQRHTVFGSRGFSACWSSATYPTVHSHLKTHLFRRELNPGPTTTAHLVHICDFVHVKNTIILMLVLL